MFKSLFFLTSLLFSTITSASMDPRKVEYNLFEIFTGVKIRGSNAFVAGTKYNGFDYDRRGNHFKVPKSFFYRSQRLAESVFRVSVNGRYGSAVHAGGDYILTNLHVISIIKNPGTRCNHLRMSSRALGPARESFQCKRVVICSKPLDFCLIEMSKGNRGTNLRNLPGPIMNISQQPDDQMTVTTLGNSANFDIQASSGFGLEKFGSARFKFYAPVWSGHSGGAIFNPADELIGIVYGGSKLLYGKRAFNSAIRIKTIFQHLSSKLKGSDREILRSFTWN